MIRLLSVLFCTLLALLPMNQALAEFRVATVDMGRILNESKEARARKQQLDEMTQTAKKKVEERQAVLKAREAKLREAKVSDTSKEAEKFRSDAREFARFVKDTEEDIKKLFLKSNKELTERAMKIVEAQAAAGNYSMILERGEKSRSAVLFAKQSFDITDTVLKEFDAN